MQSPVLSRKICSNFSCSTHILEDTEVPYLDNMSYLLGTVLDKEIGAVLLGLHTTEDRIFSQQKLQFADTYWIQSE